MSCTPNTPQPNKEFVYLVTVVYEYEGSTLIGVAKTLDLAKMLASTDATTELYVWKDLPPDIGRAGWYCCEYHIIRCNVQTEIPVPAVSND